MLNVVLMSEQMCCSGKSLRVHYIVSHSKWVIECKHWWLWCISRWYRRTSSTALIATSWKPASVGQSTQQWHWTAMHTDFTNCAWWM